MGGGLSMAGTCPVACEAPPTLPTLVCQHGQVPFCAPATEAKAAWRSREAYCPEGKYRIRETSN